MPARRWKLTKGACIAALLLIGGAWARSYFVSDWARFDLRLTHRMMLVLELRSGWGAIGLGCYRIRLVDGAALGAIDRIPHDRFWRAVSFDPEPRHAVFGSSSDPWSKLGFGAERDHWRKKLATPRGMPVAVDWKFFGFPYWVPALVAGLPLVRTAWRGRRMRGTRNGGHSAEGFPTGPGSRTSPRRAGLGGAESGTDIGNEIGTGDGKRDIG